MRKVLLVGAMAILALINITGCFYKGLLDRGEPPQRFVEPARRGSGFQDEDFTNAAISLFEELGLPANKIVAARIIGNEFHVDIVAHGPLTIDSNELVAIIWDRE